MRRRGKKRGMAIPLVIVFSGMIAFLIYYLTTNRLEQKRQNITQFRALQAHYLAQAAVQQAMLKFRILPTEAYQATALARGICPFYVAPANTTPASGAGKTPDALTTFVSDVSSDAIPMKFTDKDFQGAAFSIEDSKAITSYTSGTESINVVEITAVGVVPFWYKKPNQEDKTKGEDQLGNGNDYVWSQYTDKVTKTVEVRRSRS